MWRESYFCPVIDKFDAFTANGFAPSMLTFDDLVQWRAFTYPIIYRLMQEVS
jgi:hypothetical protein